jgi:hypothetical protein
MAQREVLVLADRLPTDQFREMALSDRLPTDCRPTAVMVHKSFSFLGTYLLK